MSDNHSISDTQSYTILSLLENSENLNENIQIVKQNQNYKMHQQYQEKSDVKSYQLFFKKEISTYQNQSFTKEQLQKHNITILGKFSYGNNAKSYQEPIVNVNHTSNSAKIVVYDVIIAKFKLRLLLININRKAEQISNHIGEGSYGIIFKRQLYNKQFAVKRIYFNEKRSVFTQYQIPTSRKKIQQVICEYSIFKICSLFKIGPSIIDGIGFDFVSYEDSIQFCMQFCDNNIKLLTEAQYRSLQKDLKESTFKLHMLNIIHKDIKPDNVLYSKKYAKYVLSDFGISHSLKETVNKKSFTYVEGTYKYMMIQMKQLLDRCNACGQVNLYVNDVECLKKTLKQIRIIANKKIRFKYEQIHDTNNDDAYEQFQQKNIDLSQLLHLIYRLFTHKQDQTDQILLYGLKDNLLNDAYEFIYNEEQQQSKNSLIKFLQPETYEKYYQLSNSIQFTSKQLRNKIYNLMKAYPWQDLDIIKQYKQYDANKYDQLKKMIKNMPRRIKQSNQFKYFYIGNSSQFIDLIKYKIQNHKKLNQNTQVLCNLYWIYIIYIQVFDPTNISQKEQILQKLKNLEISNSKYALILQIFIELDKYRESPSIDCSLLKNLFNQLHLASKLNYIYLKYIQILIQKKQMQEALKIVSIIRQQCKNNKNFTVLIYYCVTSCALYKQLGQYDNCLRQILFIQNHLCQQIEHPIKKQLQFCISSIYRLVGNYSKALEHAHKALKCCFKYRNYLNDNSIQIHLLFSQIYIDLKDFPQSINYAQKALLLIQKSYYQQEEHKAVSYYTLAINYQNLGKYKVAFEFNQKSLQINKNISVIKSGMIAQNHELLAIIMLNTRQFDQAEKILKQLLQIYNQQNMRLQKVAKTYKLLGLLYTEKKQYENAIIYLQRSLKHYKEFFKKDCIATLEVQMLLANVMSRTGLAQSIQLIEKVCDFSSKIIIPQHQLSSKCILIRAHIYFNLRKFSICQNLLYKFCRFDNKFLSNINRYEAYKLFIQLYIQTSKFSKSYRFISMYMNMNKNRYHEEIILQLSDIYYFLYKIHDKLEQKLHAYAYCILAYSIYRYKQQSTQKNELSLRLEQFGQSITYDISFKTIDKKLIENIKKKLKSFTKNEILRSLFVHKIKLKQNYKKINMIKNDYIITLIQVVLHLNQLGVVKNTRHRYLRQLETIDNQKYPKYLKILSLDV